MAVTSKTIANTLAMKAELTRYVADSEIQLARMWSQAWVEVSDEYALAVADLIDMGDGDWPTRTQVLRAQRVENALKVTLDQMNQLVPASAAAMQQNLAAVTASAQHWSEQIVKTQLPPYGIASSWSRVDSEAMNAIVRRSTGRIHSLTRPLTRDMVSQMKAVLIRGVPVGDNPRTAARQIMRRTEQTFAGGRARALNIARTELLDAHRVAATKSRAANNDVVKGWRWLATLSNRTCPSCLSQHGSLHPATELGPLDHQQGRCTAVPVTKTWDELGFKGIPEPADDFPNARAWFDRQPQDTKLRIMGPERLRRLEAGELDWSDMSTLIHTPGWRDSFHIAPLQPLGKAPKPAGFDPTPFREAKTVQEALDALRKAMGTRGTLRGIDATSAKWELDRVKDVTGTIAELFHRFPEVKCDVGFAKMQSKILAHAAAYNTRTEQFIFTRMELQINRGKMSARSTLNDNWQRDVAGGFYNLHKVDDASPMTWVARHEFGHIVDFTSANMHGGRLNRMGARKIVQDEAERHGFVRNSAEAAAWRRSQTGVYARTADAEMIAESFAEVETYGDGARDLAKAVVAGLMKHLGRTS